MKNNCAIITGGSNGFGKELTLALLKKGYKIVVGDINVEQGKKLEEESNKTAKNLIFCKCDVRDEKDLRNLFDKALENFGGANVMVNNAGIGVKENFNETTAVIDSMVGINYTAVLKGASLAIQHFNQQKKANPDSKRDFSIINVSSLSAFIPLTISPIYSSTKAAVLSLTQSLANLKYKGIRVNCVAPAFSPTNLVQSQIHNSKMAKAVASLGPLLPVEKVVSVMIRLIEDHSFAGDVIVVTSQGEKVLPKPSFERFAKL